MHILLADDHTVLREGLKSILSELPSVTRIDEASLGKEALTKMKNHAFDLVILDISLPDINGLEVLQRIKHMGIETRVAMMSFHKEEQYASRAFQLGAVGYINKNISYSELKAALLRLIRGGNYIPQEFAETLAFGKLTGKLPHEHLSNREFQVMLMLAQGKSLKEVAEVMCVADKTVSTYRRRIMEKMNITSNAEITMYAIKSGLIS